MAFPIITLGNQKVKRTPPPVPPRYSLGLIPAGHALRCSKHFLYPEGKAFALASFSEWSNKTSFIEGKCDLDAQCTTVIVTAFFLEVLPAQAETWAFSTEVGDYPYLDSPRDILVSILIYNLDELTSGGRRQATDITEQAWQLTDITTDKHELAKLVYAADYARVSVEPASAPALTCAGTSKQLTTLAQALYRAPTTIRRYAKPGKWDNSITVYYLEPTAPNGKRFSLEVQDHDNPAPFLPCTPFTVSTSYSFADPVMQRAMITLWNAAHTQARHVCAKSVPISAWD